MAKQRLLLGAGAVGALAVGLVAGFLLRGGNPAADATPVAAGGSDKTTTTIGTSPSTTATTAPPTTTSSTAPPVDPATALRAFAARYPGSLVSPVRPYAKTAYALLAYDDIALGLRFDGSAWAQDGAMTLPNSIDPPAGTIDARDVTGDGRPDFAVPLGGTHGLGAVASNHSGVWRLVPFEGEFTAVGQEDLRFQGSSVMTTDNPCEPSCAESMTYDHTWSYDPARRVFVTALDGE